MDGGHADGSAGGEEDVVDPADRRGTGTAEDRPGDRADDAVLPHLRGWGGPGLPASAALEGPLLALAAGRGAGNRPCRGGVVPVAPGDPRSLSPGGPAVDDRRDRG